MRVGVTFRWTAAGQILLEGEERLEFPRLPAEPGLYRFRLVKADRSTTYVGETVNLHRRMAGYRSPGPSQTTNQRLNQRMRAHLGSGGQVLIETCTEATLDVNGEQRTLDLGARKSRLLAENAALHALPKSEPIENLPGIGDQAGNR